MSKVAVRCRDLHKTYPPDVRAVDGLDLDIYQGECFGLLGPNGAGKTTTVEILEGLIEPTSGEVEVFGKSWKKDRKRLRQEVGISLQETRLPEKLSVIETVRMFRSFYAEGLDPEEAVRLVHLEEKSDSWVGKLSGGQRQRVEIACALIGKPELLFLDEPTTGLDPQSRRQVWEIVHDMRAEGRSILLTTHYMDEAERLCDRIAIVDRGRVIALGTPAELISSLGGDHVVEFSVAIEKSNVGSDLDVFKALPSVREVREGASGLALTVSEPHVTIPALLSVLDKRGSQLQALSTRHASLEDLFVKLTGRHLDDEN